MVYLLQHLLSDSAKQFPTKEAIVCGDEQITYKALDEITNKLAGVLKKNGVKRGDRVGIYMTKSLSSIVSIHGILKAGAVYVPLDPNAPLSRLSYIIQNCGIKCLLISTGKMKSLSQIFPENNPLEVVVLTDDAVEVQSDLPVKVVLWRDVIEHNRAALLQDQAIDTDLAYILYTSGSTGVPKGVMITHLNALTFVNWAHTTFSVSHEDRLSNHAPLHFDLSIFDIFVALKAGATLVIVPDGSSTFPIRLVDWIEHNKISIWYSVPSILSMMVLHGKLDRFRFKSMRLILFAGEVFPVKFMRSLIEAVPHPEYYNLYGPTETNVITYYKVESLTEDQVKPVPIGRACHNMEVFALTEKGALVTKPGQEGVLFARGSCIAQGYWGDVEKSNQSFIPNHIQPHFQEKMYKTGDIVTLDEEGNYIYIGRVDDMIKSRGYRIELGEIEAVLYSHPKIKEAAVVALPDDLIGHKIKAFLACSDKTVMDSADILNHCANTLPRYMIPESVEFRDHLPKTSTGKVDKTLLAKQEI